jgi:PAS domain S-box-containing protein
MAEGVHRNLQLDPFELSSSERVLRREGVALPLGSRALQVLLEDDERVFCRVGSHVNADGSALAVLPAVEQPTPAILDRLVHEYGLKEELGAAWAVRPLELMRESGRTMLVLEDPGGEPLERLLGVPFETDLFLRLAIDISVAVGRLHRQGLLHKDIKPANIMVNCADGHVRLTGFGIASRVPRERQAPEPPETIAGTLAYMAPEQTGRMNRSIDSRSDLYALGVTFYQMLTGSLPFTAADPMEWVHCHIARKPLPPSERLESIPAPVSEIIMKLLAKTAEERYQTAAGVEDDLRRCLAEWEATRRIGRFPLGTHDASDRLLIPETLYGREREIDELIAVFDRIVAQDTTELVLVSGYSGIGKSSVVNELHKALVAPRGLFASGKFDQYKRDIPYATLGQAFQSLVRSLLTQSEEELGRWRDALRGALGPNGQLIVNLVPELELVIGKQPPVPDLPPQDVQNRFQMVFRRFLGVFARKERPLALFLDDLQWLDAATLDLLEHIVTHPEVRHLLLVGAYRDNEIDSTHPLLRTLEAIRAAGARVHEIVLAPLELDDVGRLIADALHCEPERAQPLAELVQEKTGGNPFFTIQFFIALADEGLLAFDPAARAWQWDIKRIRAKSYTDNVVDLMAGKLKRFSATTQEALKQLACLGNVAPSATLALVRGTTEEAMHAALWEAIRAGLVLHQESTFRFLHDRIQQAAYSLIPDEERADFHLRIGRVLSANVAADGEHLFHVANHFNRGAALLTDRDEKTQVATIELRAGRKAKASTAYASACVYLMAGMALLDESDWDSHYDLMFSLWLERAECEYLTGKLASAEARLSLLSTRARTIADSAAVTCVRLNLYTTLDYSDRAVEVGLDYLRRVDDGPWPVRATVEDVRQAYDQLLQRLGSGSIESLVDLPLMTDPDRRATMDVLTVLTSPALFTEENLFRLVVCRMAALSLEHGNSDGSCLAYAWLGSVLGMYFGDYQAGYRFGRLGLDLVEKRGLDRFSARVYLVCAVHVVNWTQNLSMSRGLLRRAFEGAQQAGDLSYVAYSCVDLVTNFLAAGDPLGEADREAANGLEFVRKMSFGLVSDCMTGQRRLIRMLRGLRPAFTSFDGAEFDEGRFEQRLESKPQLAIAASYYWIRKLQACFYAGDYASAVAAASKAESVLWTTPTQFELAEYHFYAALARAAHCDKAAAEERSRHLEALASHLKQIAIWADNCPATFANRAALVGAELARLQGRELDAERLYEEAIHSARKHGFVQNEGLAHEVAARFYAARGFDTFARAYLREARRCYLRWGASGKVRQLDETYPDLRQEDPLPGPTTTIGASVEHLDLATVIKVSQAVSGEIVFENLIDTLMRTAMVQAGAERALLILLRGREPRIEAEATTSGDTVTVRLVDEAVTERVLPESVLHYVLRTREIVILDDASAQSPFGVDSYIRQRQARSILCLPLLNQAKLIGVLYLENNLTPRVFAPARISVLKLLASQAAIALENAHLYRDVAERETKIRRLVDSNIIGIFIWDFDGRVLEANDEFLRMVNYDREDLVAGRIMWADLTPPDWRDRNNARIEQQKGGDRFEPFEKEYTRKDGSRVPVLIGGATFEEGSNQGVAFVLDLTERKRADEALMRSEAYLAETQKLTRTGSWAWDVRTQKVLHCSEEMFRIFGLDPQEHLPTRKNFRQRVHPDDRNRVDESFARVVNERVDSFDEYRVVLPDGTVKHVNSSGHPVLDGNGELIEFVGTATDVTERKRAEEALRESEAKFSDYAATASDWLWEIGPDYKFTLLTENAFHSNPAERIGTFCWDHVLDLETEPEKWRLVRETLDSRKPFHNFVYCSVDGTGSPMYVKASGKPVFDANGEFRGYRGTGTDVTAIIRAQRAEASLRTSEQRYREVQLELAHANRVATLGQLTASITHEVNQPITAAVTYALAARRWLGAEPPNFHEVDDALSLIVKEGNRAGEVVGRIRALIKKAPARKDAVEINDAILEVIALTRTEAANNSVSVRMQLAEGLPRVQGDRVQLQQVLLNLIINAIEAMRDIGEEERELLICSRNEPDGVSVEVRDSGPGFAPPDLERVFEAFYTTKPGGLGLGLSICRSIIEAHDGRLWASANVPRGAIFGFIAPAHPSAAS